MAAELNKQFIAYQIDLTHRFPVRTYTVVPGSREFHHIRKMPPHCLKCYKHMDEEFVCECNGAR